MSNINVIINNKQRHYRLPAKKIKGLAERVLKSEGCRQTQANILFTDDRTIKAYNKKYRRKDRPTDVLAFYQSRSRKEALASELLGDVVISAQTARRQAKERASSIYDEIALYVIHGLLHLLQYKDSSQKEKEALNKKQQALFKTYAKKKTSR